MRFYRIDMAGGSYFFFPIGAERGAESAPGGFLPPSADGVRIFVLPSLTADLRLETPDGSADGEDVLRAFSAYLSLVRGYPACETEIEFSGKVVRLSLREGGEDRFFFRPAPPCRFLGEETLAVDEKKIRLADIACSGLHRLFPAKAPDRVDFSFLAGPLARLGAGSRGAVALSLSPDEEGNYSFSFCPTGGEPVGFPDARAAAVCAFSLRRLALCREREIRLVCGGKTAAVRWLADGSFSVGLRCDGAYAGRWGTETP